MALKPLGGPTHLYALAHTDGAQEAVVALELDRAHLLSEALEREVGAFEQAIIVDVDRRLIDAGTYALRRGPRHPLLLGAEYLVQAVLPVIVAKARRREGSLQSGWTA